jgi:hypothetical protein
MDRLEWYRFKTNNNLFSAAACALTPFPVALVQISRRRARDLSPDANQRILNDKIIPI